MKGLYYLVDGDGKRKGFLVEFSDWSEEEQEDLEDVVISLLRRNQPTVPWEDVKAEMDKGNKSKKLKKIK